MNFKQIIIDQIIKLVDSIYPDYPITESKDIQGIKPPRFLITCYQSEPRKRISHAGWFYDFYFDLMFDPGTDNPEEKCNEVSFYLAPALFKIPNGGYNFRPNRVESQYDRENNMLHIFIDIVDFAIIEEPIKKPKIERVISDIEIKEVE